MRHWTSSCRRLAVFLADDNGQILYRGKAGGKKKCYPGELRQPIEKLASVSFQDVDNDSDTDIILIAQCHNDRGDYQEKSYKVGDVLFQENGSFYRDYRISDKINRFDMNKNPACPMRCLTPPIKYPCCQDRSILYRTKKWDAFIPLPVKN